MLGYRGHAIAAFSPARKRVAKLLFDRVLSKPDCNIFFMHSRLAAEREIDLTYYPTSNQVGRSAQVISLSSIRAPDNSETQHNFHNVRHWFQKSAHSLHTQVQIQTLIGNCHELGQRQQVKLPHSCGVQWTSPQMDAALPTELAPACQSTNY